MKTCATSNMSVFSGDKAAFYMITGFISNILHGEEGNPKQLYYLACPACKKKMVNDFNGYKCERCDKTFKEAVPTYNFAIRINDFTDSQIFNVLGECGEALMGMTATELFKHHGDFSRIDEICRNQSFRDVQLLIRVKAEDNHMGEQNIKYVITRS
jgi:replication factor A1